MKAIFLLVFFSSFFPKPKKKKVGRHGVLGPPHRAKSDEWTDDERRRRRLGIAAFVRR